MPAGSRSVGIGSRPGGTPLDDCFWTEILGVSVKVVGPLPPPGEPDVVEGSVPGGEALLTWFGENGRRTVVSYGKRIPLPKLRALAG